MLWLIYIVIIGLTVTIDQISKFLAVEFLKQIGTFPIINDVFHLTYVQNTGAAFSILSGKTTFLAIITFIVLVVGGVYLFKFKGKKIDLESIAISLIIGGGIGNLIDRISQGYVVDMFDFRLINFAVFNVADSFVSVGTVLLLTSVIIDLVKDNKDKQMVRENTDE